MGQILVQIYYLTLKMKVQSTNKASTVYLIIYPNVLHYVWITVRGFIDSTSIFFKKQKLLFVISINTGQLIVSSGTGLLKQTLFQKIQVGKYFVCSVVWSIMFLKSEKTGLPNLIRSLVRKEIFQPEKNLGKEVFVRE